MGGVQKWIASTVGGLAVTTFLSAATQNLDPSIIGIPADSVLNGRAIERYLSDPAKDMSGRGVALRSTSGAGSVAKDCSWPHRQRTPLLSIQHLWTPAGRLFGWQ